MWARLWCTLFGHRWRALRARTTGIIGPTKVCARCGVTSWGHPVLRVHGPGRLHGGH